MKLKFNLLIVISLCAFHLAKAQIGATTLATPPPIGISPIGQSSDYGKSTLPVCQPRSISCSQAFTYTFIGNGNWTIETNWDGNMIPPATLPAGAKIVVDPQIGGECILNIIQTIANGATILVKGGKKLKLTNNLIIVQ